MEAKIVGVSITEELHGKLTAIAKLNGTTVTELFRMAAVNLSEKHATKKIPGKELLKGKK